MFGEPSDTFVTLVYMANSIIAIRDLVKEFQILKQTSPNTCGVVATLYKKCERYSGTDGERKYCPSLYKVLYKGCFDHKKYLQEADIGEEGQHDHLNSKPSCEGLTKIYQECTSKLGGNHVACTLYNKDLSQYCLDGKPIESVWKQILDKTVSHWGDKVDSKSSA